MSSNKSAYERELEEKYEEAAFELMMYRMMQSQGEALLEENKLLKEEPDPDYPEDLDRKIIKLIDHHFRAKKRQVFYQSAKKVVTTVAVVFLVLAIGFTIPFATARAFRTATLDFFVQRFGDGISLETGEPDTIDDMAADHRFPTWFPHGEWSMKSMNTDDPYTLEYENEEGSIITYTEYLSENLGLTYDTEDVVIREDCFVQGYPALSIQKADSIVLMWVDEERDCVCNLILSGNAALYSIEEMIHIADSIE